MTGPLYDVKADEVVLGDAGDGSTVAVYDVSTFRKWHASTLGMNRLPAPVTLEEFPTWQIKLDRSIAVLDRNLELKPQMPRKSLIQLLIIAGAAVITLLLLLPRILRKNSQL